MGRVVTEKNAQFPPIVSSSGLNDAQRQQISRAVRAGHLRRLTPGLYTSDIHAPAEAVVKRHTYRIAALLYPDAVIGYRTAMEGGTGDRGVMFLTHEGSPRSLPGLAFRPVAGHGALDTDTRFGGGGNIHVAGMARFLLENLTPSRAGQFVARSMGARAVEQYLDRRASIQGEGELNVLRDEARDIAPALGLTDEQQRLDGMIAALLGTHDSTQPLTPAGRARAKGAPVDTDRLHQFEHLAVQLNSMTHEHVAVPVRETRDSPDARAAYWRNAAFFESYFSNYIEGTVFDLDEARAIVYDAKLPANRPQDAHDVLGLFQMIANESEAMMTPDDADVLIGTLKRRHKAIFGERSNVQPGQFKEIANRAGNYAFVGPGQVLGTLRTGFEIGRQLRDPVSRATFTHVLVSEVHPFADGNGRLARLFMNAELSRAGLSRVIVPNVLRDDYLDVVRLMSREHDSGPFVRLITQAQQMHQAIPFEDYDAAAGTLRRCNAFAEPGPQNRLMWPSLEGPRSSTAATSTQDDQEHEGSNSAPKPR